MLEALPLFLLGPAGIRACALCALGIEGIGLAVCDDDRFGRGRLNARPSEWSPMSLRFRSASLIRCAPDEPACEPGLGSLAPA